MQYNQEEKRIIRTLYAANKPLTTKKISEKTEMAWRTAKKYLGQLYKNRIVDCGRYGKSIYWWLRTRA